MKFFLHTFLSIIISTLLAQASEKIHLELSTTKCLPGDLIELKATYSTPTYQDFTLTIPKNTNLQLIAKENNHTTLKNNQYSQTKLWIFQAIAPGQHTLSNIIAKTTSNENSIQLAPITLTVGTYPSLDQDLTPAPFPTTTIQSSTKPYSWFLLIIPIFLCSYIIKTNKLKSTPTEEPTNPLSINTLKQKLTKGTIPEPTCFQLLEQNPTTLTKTQRTLIQQALYQPSFTANDLLESLNKEDHE